jgi:hypothetical protein
VWVGLASRDCSSDLSLRIDSPAHLWSSQALLVGSLVDCCVEALERRYLGTGTTAGMTERTATGRRDQVSE